MTQSSLKISNAALFAAGLIFAAMPISGQVRNGSPLVGQNGTRIETGMSPELISYNQNSQVNKNDQMNKSGMNPYMPSNGPMAPQNNAAFTEQHVSDSIRENMALEIKLNRLALQRSHNPKIKNFAQRIIAENKKIDLDAKRLAPDQSGTFPNASFAGTRQAVDSQAAEKKMMTVTGPKFDELYLVQMSAYLRSDIQMGHSAYAMMQFPNISPVGLNLWNLSRKRMDQLAKIANEEHVHIITD